MLGIYISACGLTKSRLILFMTATLCGTVRATEYNLVFLSSGSGGQASGIDAGVAVGVVSGNGAVWPDPTGYTNLTPRPTDPSGYSSSEALGIHGSQIVGDGEFRAGGLHALLWQGFSPDAVVDLTPGASNATSIARATDGTYQVGETNMLAMPVTAVAWRGTPQSLMPIGAAFSTSSATGVWNGIAVGYGATQLTTTHAILWDLSSGSMVDLNPSGASGSYAWGISHNQIVGTATAHSTNQRLAGYWIGENPASFVNLNPDVASASDAYGTNGTQQVGAISLAADPLSDSHAVVWNGSANDFQYLPVPSPYTFSEARSIDDQGRIVGNLWEYSTGDVPVIWVPVPEPTALIGIGCVALCLRRGRATLRVAAQP
jgi:hypothetical protein